VDANGAASAEVVVSPASISFGRAGGDGWHGRVTLTLHNTSTRDLTVYLDARGATGDIVLELTRDRLNVPAGRSARVTAGVRLLGVPDEAAVSGTIRVDPRDGTAVDVPWTFVASPPPDDLIGDVELSEETFSLRPRHRARRRVGTIVSRADGTPIGRRAS
jgi:hypothetical protein